VKTAENKPFLTRRENPEQALKLFRAKLEQTVIISEPNVNKKCKTHANIRNNYFCTLFVFSSSNQNSMSASKRILSACLISALLLFCGQAFAQKSHKKKKKEPDFVSNLWYGGGLLLGFNGINNASIFSLGVSPMVGYKITPAISVGPRVEFILSSYKQIGYQATSLYDFDAGLFAREVSSFRGKSLMNGIRILTFLKTNTRFNDSTSVSAEAGTGVTDAQVLKSASFTILQSPTILTHTRIHCLTGSASPGTFDFSQPAQLFLHEKYFFFPLPACILCFARSGQEL
jgi:hypothetical protein